MQLVDRRCPCLDQIATALERGATLGDEVLRTVQRLDGGGL